MDNTSQSQTDQTNQIPSDTTQDLAHVTQEMYKKNFELAEINKTLSLLRKIDEIILTSVTDTYHIAQQVVDIVAAEADFKSAAIYLVENKTNTLNCIAVAKTEVMNKILSSIQKPFFTPIISLNEMSNYIAASVREKKMRISHTESDILIPYFTDWELQQIQKIDAIKSSLIYPLIARDTPIGALIINLGEDEASLFQYQKDLIDRLSGVISIAIDNALLYQKIQDANERLKTLDKLKDEFVSLASHELRTPMSAIKSYLWLILSERQDLGKLSDKQKEYISRVYQSADRLTLLVNDMLDVSRIESGRMSITQKPADIVQLAQDAIADVLPNAQNAGVTLSIEPLTNPLPLVSLDTNKIKEVFINLIGNSLKFTPQDGKITISFEQQDSMILTHVHDTGTGIKPEDMSRLFQKFGMIEDNYLAMPASQGTGLGLYITKSIVELHGGKISVFSEGQGKGTTFSFSLPIAN
jgi:signal transduction histidine kinase